MFGYYSNNKSGMGLEFHDLRVGIAESITSYTSFQGDYSEQERDMINCLKNDHFPEYYIYDLLELIFIEYGSGMNVRYINFNASKEIIDTLLERYTNSSSWDFVLSEEMYTKLFVLALEGGRFFQIFWDFAERQNLTGAMPESIVREIKSKSNICRDDIIDSLVRIHIRNNNTLQQLKKDLLFELLNAGERYDELNIRKILESLDSEVCFDKDLAAKFNECPSLKDLVVRILVTGQESIDRSLIKAAQYDNFEIVKLLVENDANVNFSDLGGCSALYYALKNNNAEIQNFLLENGCMKKPLINKGLVYDAGYDGCQIVEMLVENGADINYTNEDGESALYYAFLYNSEKKGFLLESGASVENLVKFMSKQESLTALNYDFTSFLISHIDETDLSDKEKSNFLHKISDYISSSYFFPEDCKLALKLMCCAHEDEATLDLEKFFWENESDGGAKFCPFHVRGAESTAKITGEAAGGADIDS